MQRAGIRVERSRSPQENVPEHGLHEPRGEEEGERLERRRRPAENRCPQEDSGDEEGDVLGDVYRSMSESGVEECGKVPDDEDERCRDSREQRPGTRRDVRAEAEEHEDRYELDEQQVPAHVAGERVALTGQNSDVRSSDDGGYGNERDPSILRSAASQSRSSFGERQYRSRIASALR